MFQGRFPGLVGRPQRLQQRRFRQMTPKPPKKGQNPPKLGIFGVKSGDFGFEWEKMAKMMVIKKVIWGLGVEMGGNGGFGGNGPKNGVKNGDFW